MKNKEAERYSIAKIIMSTYTPKGAMRVAKIILSMVCDKEEVPSVIYNDIDDILDKLRHYIDNR